MCGSEQHKPSLDQFKSCILAFYKFGTVIAHLTSLTTQISHILLSELAVLGPVFIALYLALLLVLHKSVRRSANCFLALALVSMVSGMCTPMTFGLVTGPLIYCYVRKLTDNTYTLRHKDGVHLIPILLQVCAWPFTDTAWHTVFAFSALVSLIIYLYFSRRHIQGFYRRQKFIGADRYHQAFNWLYDRLTAFFILSLISLAVMSACYFFPGDTASANAYTYSNILLFCTLIEIGGKALLRSPAVSTEHALPVLKPLQPAELKAKAAWVKQEVKSRRYYEDPELTLSSLAGKLELTVHELSGIINRVFKKSFNDFINEYRVREVITKMQDPAYHHITLLGIAYASGFNSKATFNRIFKQITGKSPVTYKELLKKEVSPYNLRRYANAAEVISNRKLTCNTMFKNYVKTAWRSVRRNKTYTVINITGLTVGVAACLLIFLVIRFETSFDTFHTKKAQIYRVIGVTKKPVYSLSSGVAFPVAPALSLDFPQVEQVASILRNEGGLFGINDKKFKENETYYAGPEFFGMFDFSWLAGDRKTALAEPNTVALTRDEANKFFGDWHRALGQIILYKNKTNLKVTGILENVPANSDFPLKIVISYATLRTKGADFDANSTDWGWVIGENYCFVALPQGADVKSYDKQLDAFIKRHIPARYADAASMQLQPLTEMHYDSRADIFSGHAFSRSLINAISLIGLFLLTIACVNFINLATAQAVNRSKEVGIRKVLGSDRKGLILQFMSETALIAAFSILLAVVLAELALPLLNDLLEVQLSGWFILQGAVATFLALLWTMVTLLAGFYPALVLSGYNPVAALRNRITSVSSSGISLRRGLVVLQFSIAQVLIIGTLVILSQLNYFKDRPLGYAKDAIVTIPVPNDSLSRTKQAALRNELLQRPGVAGVSFSYGSPSDENAWFSSIHFNNSAKETDFGVSLKWADAAYFKLYGLQFVAGGPYAASDTLHGYVINETLAKKLGLTDPRRAIGKLINLGGQAFTNKPVVGVVRDFATGSLKDNIPPVLISSYKGSYQLLSVKLRPNNMNGTLSQIERQFNTSFPQALYEYHFVDQQVAHFYKTETQLSKLYQIFAGIALLISCLGLFGLVSFMAVQRTKEVGIRKTLGASAGQIVYLFSKEFTLLVLIAFAISGPIAGYLMNLWLQSFAFRIRLGPGVFVQAITFSVIIAWLTVGYKAISAALVKPVKSLKSE